MENSSVRLYEVSDSKMIDKAQMITLTFQPLNKYFTKHYPKYFPENYSDTLKEKIDECNSFKSDRYCVENTADKTSNLQKAEKSFLHKYRAIRIIIEDTFANEPDKLSQLGVGNITEKRQKRDALFNFAELFCHLIRKYELQLKENGCREELILSIENLFYQMKEIRMQRDRMKVERQNIKAERITLLNSLWTMISEICKTAPYALEELEYIPAAFILPRRKKSRKKNTEVPQETRMDQNFQFCERVSTESI